MTSEIEIEIDPKNVVFEEEWDEKSAFNCFKMTKHPFKYSCPFCGKRYTSRSGLLSHKNSVHFQRRPYRCQYCNDHFHSSAQRVGHIKKVHPQFALKEKQTMEKPSHELLEDPDDPGEASPPEGNNTVSLGNSITISLLKPVQQPKQNRYGKSIGPKGNNWLVKPEQNKSKEKHFATFVPSEHLAHPYEERKIGKDEVLDKYVCVECNKAFLRAETLLQHLSIHLKKLENESETTEENKIAVKKNIFSCDICKRNFPSKTWYRIHNKYHHPDLYQRDTESDTQLKCTWCKKMYNRGRSRLLHECLHCKHASLTCQRCEYRYTSVQDFIRHLNKEHGCQRLKCPLCSYATAEKEEYVKHLESNHGNTEVLLKCGFCGERFDKFRPFYQHLLQHMDGATKDVMIIKE